jgi:hypothetical protein
VIQHEAILINIGGITSRFIKNAFASLNRAAFLPGGKGRSLRHISTTGLVRILDPFCGTGQTILAAERLGRRWIACDISRK